MAQVWQQVLGRARIGREDNFFDLGGHSLLATQVVSRLREALGVELALRALFESPTVAGLARHVDAAVRPTPSAAVPGIHRAPPGTPAVLSFAQERLWFLDQLEPGNPFYNVPIALRLTGPLDVAALAGSIDAIVQRHEVLRTTFPATDGRPAPRIAAVATATLALPVIDLAAMPAAQRTAEAERLIVAEGREPFDLARGPLLRTRLVRLAPDEHVLLFTMHHIVADGWSLGVLVRELEPLYRHRGDAQAAALATLPIQYSDFAAWQRDRLQGDLLHAQLAYWKQRLADAPPALDLPTDRPRPSAQSYRGSSVQTAIDATLAEALRRLGQRTGSTLFMTLLAAFATLLHRYSGQSDLVIGSPIANRTRGETEPLVGFFVNTLALRVDLAGNPTFEELLARVRRTALDAYAHQDLPFERLVDELQPERDLSLNPLFQVMFALQNAPIGRLQLAGLSAELLPTRHQSALFDLVLDMWEADGALVCLLEYNLDLHDEASALRMLGHLRTLLASIAADPARPIADLAWLTDDDERALLATGTGALRRYPVERTLHDLVAEQAARDPGRIAATHRGRSITYRELDTCANRLAHRLLGLGLAPGEFVALLDDRGIDLLAAMLGVLKVGAAFVPIDPSYPPGRIAHMLADSRAPVLVARSARLAQLPPLAHAVRVLRLDAGDDLDEPAAPPARRGSGRDLAYMLYTSGSTGLPKGAMVRHDGAINHVCAEAELLGLDRDTVLLQSAPSSSDISVWQFLGPLLIGARTVIADYETVCDAAALHAAIRAEGVTLIELVPAAMKALLDHAVALPAAERALPRLTTAMVTGEAATPALVDQWRATYPGAILVNAYGPTEAADDVCQAVLDRPPAGDRRTVPIGRPLPNLTLYVLDARLRLVPLGVPGEICVSGVGVGAGYWGNEARTRESFVANPYAAPGRGEVLYRTGDRGRWLADGALECLERIDHQVKLRGFRIELGEIEALLAKHSAIGQAAVVVHGAASGDARLVACIVPDTQSATVRSALGELQRLQVGLWQDLHEDSYGGEPSAGDPTFNVVGWDSNYTGRPLPEAEMREYVAFTVERIRSLGPGRVLEIGCGSGLVMFALLPHCASYSGIDLSTQAIRRLRELQASCALQARIPGLERAALSCQRADDGAATAPGSVDTVALPSVVQYFPSIDYLLDVLDHVFSHVLAPGGSVFVGDVRSLPLLEAFHASVQLHKAAPGELAAAIAQRVRQRLAQEQELAVDPGFFEALKQRHASISEVQILPKRGSLHNEMTRLRYDVLIRTAAGGARRPAAAMPWVDWLRERPGIDDLARRWRTERPAAIALRRIANPRTAEALAAADAVLRGRADAEAAELRAQVAAAPATGIEPEALWRLGRECGVQVDLSLAGGHPDGSYDAVLRPSGDAPADAPGLAPVAWPLCESALRPWSRYANAPLYEKLGRRLAPALREFLQERLPHYMVPASFVMLPALPLTPVGKVDRAALPAPSAGDGAAPDASALPRDREEQVLAALWAEVLGLAQVGIHDNFFELGGHSLKATQVMSRIQRECGVEVALRELFAHPTIAELASRLRSAQPAHPARSAAIPKVPDADHHPLSHAQRRLWVLSQLDGASPAYNLPLALRFDGPLDAGAFERAYAQLLERHESLRTVFVVVDNAPRQRVVPPGAATLAVTDLRRDPDPEAAARRLALADAMTPFDLERGAVRASLLRVGDARHVLLLTMHHIASDDWSLGVMAREFVQLYASHLHGERTLLPPLALQYRDYACWQLDYLSSDAAAAHRAYWHARLAGQLPVLDLATDLPRPPVRTQRGRSVASRLEARQATALAALARARHASLFMVLVALVQTLLHRHTGQDELMLGFPIAGRDHPDLEGQVGFYVNLLPLRLRVDGEAPFVELLDAVRDAATEAYEHQAYPFDRLVDELDVARDIGRAPMFDVVVVMQNAAAPTQAPEGLAVSAFVTDYEVAKFDLSFTFEERDGALLIDLTYSPDLFLSGRIEQLAGHLRTLVESVIADATMPVARLPMLPAAERRQLLAGDRPRAVAAPSADTLVSLFEQQARRDPHRVALVWPETAPERAPGEAGPRHALTYGELDARAGRLADRLRGLGVGRDLRVGVCLPRSIELVVALIAVLKAGGAYVPLDAALPAERRSFMLDDAGAGLVVTRRGLAPGFAGAGATLVCLDDDDDDEDGAAAAARSSPAAAPAPDDLAYVIYTSGSTGRPKGVAVTHRNVVRLFTTSRALFGFDDQDVWTLFHSCAFDFSVWELWGALLHGARLVVVPQAVSRAPEAFRALLARERVTMLSQTPSAFRQLIHADADAPCGPGLALRHVVFGGEALDVQSLRPWFARHGDQVPRLVNMYGITETTVHVTHRVLTAADLERPGSCIGRALPDLKLLLLDRHLQPVPVGVAGEIHVGGPGVARGYLNRPELTAERFIPDPFDPASHRHGQARLYRSGDLGRRLVDGEIEYLGRIDQQVQIRGFRVEPGEIEVLLAAHPGVREAVVLPHGDGERRHLRAYVVTAPGAQASADALRRHLQAQLPDYMVPAAFIDVERLTLTANGKLDRDALLKLDLAGGHAPLAATGAPPQGELERTVAALFDEVVGGSKIGRDDNFFDAGANSLLLIQLQRRLRESLQRDVPALWLFQYPTVAVLAARLGGGETGAAPASGAPPGRERGEQRKAARAGRKRSATPSLSDAFAAPSGPLGADPGDRS
ncbi:non-ribosomal peptide synthetase [Variovorax sp. J22R115]|uniref:non-ribosomal peptide synthetase n=1 Tax=Variovorax sp. J22R115 TaxID=3053509 RepID=UPI0025787104|nr:non-ribosomal peptide synthetase [Variovorax sp. J22R115]MDM0053946.1 amino acid adenylation domain-containing protein [Variovorax sp. J22R115]